MLAAFFSVLPGMKELPDIFTIGHSTRTLEEFIGLLDAFEIKLLVDIRNFPGSRKFPHFGKDSLELNMPAAGIRYMHLKALGGRRKPDPDSPNTAWRSAAFRAYADHMGSVEFKAALEELKSSALKTRTAYMCSEAVWWRCHRALVSDQLKVDGWKVLHIMALNKLSEHPYTSAASVRNGRLSYTGDETSD
jgi:uncharacterized protein (DUF488 family)